jgi:ubiquinone/menaquinone biosynthesis C-methylase UbiE
MLHVEVLIKEYLYPVHKLWYSAWVYWWPAWRGLYSGKQIRSKWTKYNLIHEGQSMLDFGCGTGDFTIPAAKIVGKQGKIYALDCNERQLELVEKKAEKAGLKNIKTILSEQKTDLPDGSLDVVWICDVLHEIRNKREVISEASRLLKKDGILLIYDGMRGKVLSYVDGLFRLETHEGKFLKLVK